MPNDSVIHIPRGCLRYAMLQCYNSPLLWRPRIVRKVSNKFPRLRLHEWIVSLESTFLPGRAERIISKEFLEQYNIIKCHLPSLPDGANILDIGCGQAMIDVLLWRHYLNTINIHLLDKTAIDHAIYPGCRNESRFYASLSEAKKLLETNGVPARRIFLQEATDDNAISFRKQFDLVISISSWGLIYPIHTYLEQVYENLRIGGYLMLDCRRGLGYEEILRKKFGNIKEFGSWGKAAKVLCQKLA